MKTCKKCGKCKKLEEFYTHPRTKDGRKGSCKVCDATRTNAWRKENPERTRVTNRRCKLKAYFGITLEQYDSILAAQDGCCAICGTDAPGGRDNTFNVDHDHSCCPGKKTCGRCIRGLLCNRCNVGLGCLGDSAEGIAKALTYVTTSCMVVI